MLNLQQAAAENRREELTWELNRQKELLKLQVLGTAAAIAEAVSGGKAQALQKWLKALEDEPPPNWTEKVVLSSGTRAFFGGAPVLRKKA